MDETKRNRSLFRLCLSLFAAMLLLANPIVGLFDFLPDALAWGLLFFALRDLSDIERNLFAARRQTVYLFVISALKGILSVSVRQYANESNRLLAVTVFGLVETFCMWLFFRSFLSGAETLSRNGNGEKMYGKIETVRFTCSFFLIARTLCTFLPELTALPKLLVSYAKEEGVELSDWMLELAAGRELLVTVFFGLELIAAGVWLAQFLPFLWQFRADKSLSAYLKEQLYRNTPERKRSRTLSSFRSARVCFAVGMLCVLDLQIDGIWVLPLFGFPLLLMLGCWFLRRFSERVPFRRLLISCAVSTVLLLLAQVYRRFFTVWDALVFGEIGIGSELLCALCMLVGMTSLFWVWMLYSGYMEAFAASFGCGHPYLTGLPYSLLTLYALLQTTVFVLPPADRVLPLFRVLAAAAFWVCTNHRLAALEEQFTGAVSLQTGERSFD